jgi:tetratricopeptide (TPR) repeat protein
MRRKTGLLLFTIIGIGAVLRIFYVLEIMKSGFFYFPFGDPEYFDRWAINISQGNIVGEEVFFKAPLYPYVLAIFYRIFGHNLLIPRILNIVFDSFSIYFIYLIAKRIFNRRTGIITSTIAAFAGIFIYFSGEVLGTSLSILLALMAFYLLLTAKARVWRWLGAGLVCSLVIFVRTNFIVCIPAIILYIFMKKELITKKIKLSLFFIGGCLLIFVVTIRNYAVSEDFVLVNYSGGVNFYIGNNVHSNGVSAVLPGYGNDWDEYSIAELETGKTLKPGEVSRFWLIKGLRFIREHPSRFLFLFIKKTYLLCNGKEISNNQSIYNYIKNSRMLSVLLFLVGSRLIYFSFPSSIIFSLAFSGIIISLKKKKYILLPLLMIGFYGFSVILFFVSTRYRMIFFVFLFPFAGYSLFWLSKNIKIRNKILFWCLTFIPFLVLCNFDPFKTSMENLALEYYNLGNVYLKKGELEMAEEYYKKGLQINETFPRLHLNLGAVYFKKDNFRKAEKAYLEEIKVNPNDARAYHNLSLLYGREGNIQDAIGFGKQALKRKTRFFDGYMNLAKLYLRKEVYDSAHIYLKEAHRLDSSEGEVIKLLGLVNLKLGRFTDAAMFYERAKTTVEDEPLVFYNLAVAYISLNKLNKARENLIYALSLKEDFVEAHYNLGLIYLTQGDSIKAKLQFEEVLGIDPGFAPAKKMIEKIE